MGRLWLQFRAWLEANPGGIRAFLWGFLGLCCFAVAAWLTFTISHVTTALSAVAPDRLEADSRGWYFFAVRAEAGIVGPAIVSFDHTLEDSEAVMSFELPQGTRSILVDDLMPNGYGCRHLAGQTADPRGDELPWESVSNFTAFDVSALTGSGGVTITCNMRPDYLQDSFTTVASSFHNVNAIEVPAGQQLLPVQLVINGRDGPVDIAASNRASLGDAPVLAPNGNVTVRFHSMRAEEARDWNILLIGVLIGFGAAMLIEAIRPLIERIGQRAD